MESDGTEPLYMAKQGDLVAYYKPGGQVFYSRVAGVNGNRVTLLDRSEWRTRGGVRWGHSQLVTERERARVVRDAKAFVEARRKEGCS